MRRVLAIVLTLLVASATFGALAPVAQAAAVTAEPAKLSEPIVGASAVHLDGKTYILGGRLKSGEYSAKILGYDLAADVLSEVRNLPSALGGGNAGRYSGTAAALNGKVYYFGGAQLVEYDLDPQNNNGPEKVPKASPDIIVFDPATNAASVLSEKLPKGAWGMTSAVYGGYIYLFGGFTFDITDLASTGRHDWVLRFDPATQKVKQLDTKLPYALQDGAAATLGRRVLVMGGLSDHDNNTNPCPTYTYYDSDTGQEETAQPTVCVTKRIVTFDPTTPDYEAVVGVAGELPYRAQFVSAAVVDGKAYIPGAYLTDGSASSSIVEVSVDRVGTPSTRVLTPTLPAGTFGQAVTTDGQTILIAGGRMGGERELSDQILHLDPRPTPPWAPRAATASDIQGGVRLTWEAPTYNGDAVITGYRIYRTPVGGEEVRVTETTSLSYDDKGVLPGTEYTWRITAVNAAGESPQGARVSRASGITVPGAVSAFSAFPGNNEVVLRWRAPEETGGSNLTGYRVIRNGEILASLPPDTTEYADRAVENGQTYLYQVRASNAKGDGPLSETQRITPAPVPPAPTGVTAEPITSGTASAVRITWFAAAAPVDSYIVYRSSLPGRPGAVIANVSDTTYIDNLVERGRTYYYTVASSNDVGTSPPSTESGVSLVSKPGAPTQVTAVGLEGEIRVSWAAPSDTGDAPPSALRYYVSRTGAGSSRSIIIKTDIEGTTFIDRTATPGQPYTYTVTTLNPMASDPSEPATATASVIQNRPPTSILAILPPITSPGDPVELDASQSSDVDGSIKSYLFDFGDGTDPVTTDQASVTHQYAVNGTYTATVIVTDNRGDVSQPAKAQVIVGEVVTDRVETGISGGALGARRTGSSAAPGSETPEIPGPGAALVLVGLAAVALALRRRSA